jgi:hypothetical protein
MYEKGTIDFSHNILELTFHEVVEYFFVHIACTATKYKNPI